MKVLIAILSCHSLRYCEQSLRDTWIPEIPAGVDYKFFLGRREGVHDSSLFLLEKDEVKLGVGDGWYDIARKTVEVYKWALECGYDYVFKCDTDTLVRPELLLKSGFEAYPFSGGQNCHFASGGSGYWLSRASMETITNSPVKYGPEEDLNTAETLAEKGVYVHHDERYVFRPGYKMDDSTISYHLTSIRQWGKVPYEPKWMYDAWADQKAKNYRAYSLVSEMKEEKKNRPLRVPHR